ncbi:MAG TPA: hypothetical protein VGC79_01500 [Polyangiaceae bacterium]
MHRWWRAVALGFPLIACQRLPKTTRAEPAPPVAPSQSVAAPSDSVAAPGNSVSAPGKPPSACAAFLSEARTELLARGFSPTQDTARWLAVNDEAPDGPSLSIVMRAGADGASTWYRASVSSGAGSDSAWRRRSQRFCCDEHAAPEDHLHELNWKRRHARQLAELSIVYFRGPKQPQIEAERALFDGVTKPALDRCLDALVTP